MVKAFRLSGLNLGSGVEASGEGVRPSKKNRKSAEGELTQIKRHRGAASEGRQKGNDRRDRGHCFWAENAYFGFMNMVTVATFNEPSSAEPLHQKLEKAGIHSEICDESKYECRLSRVFGGEIGR